MIEVTQPAPLTGNISAPVRAPWPLWVRPMDGRRFSHAPGSLLSSSSAKPLVEVWGPPFWLIPLPLTAFHTRNFLHWIWKIGIFPLQQYFKHLSSLISPCCFLLCEPSNPSPFDQHVFWILGHFSLSFSLDCLPLLDAFFASWGPHVDSWDFSIIAQKEEFITHTPEYTFQGDFSILLQQSEVFFCGSFIQLSPVQSHILLQQIKSLFQEQNPGATQTRDSLKPPTLAQRTFRFIQFLPLSF